MFRRRPSATTETTRTISRATPPAANVSTSASVNNCDTRRPRAGAKGVAGGELLPARVTVRA